MAYTITRKTLDPLPFLFIRKKVGHTEVGAALGEILPKVYGHAMKAGLPFASPPICRYADFSAAGFVIEAGMAIGKPVEGEGELLAGTLAGGPVAVTLHRGPYEGLGKAHRAVEAWFAEQGLQKGGEPWEVYVTDPGQVPDPEKWETEVVWPIAG